MSKIRLDFVTNSSSSSYTCCVCGESVVLYDGDENDMIRCERNHLFCERHLNGYSSIDDLVDFLISNEVETEDSVEYFRDELPSIYCPVCSFMKVIPEQALKYLMLQKGINVDELLFELKTNFNNYDDFIKYIS